METSAEHRSARLQRLRQRLLVAFIIACLADRYYATLTFAITGPGFNLYVYGAVGLVLYRIGRAIVDRKSPGAGIVDSRLMVPIAAMAMIPAGAALYGACLLLG